jgi:hypothetical protein
MKQVSQVGVDVDSEKLVCAMQCAGRVERVMGNSDPQGEAPRGGLLGPERARIPYPTSFALALPFRRMY